MFLNLQVITLQDKFSQIEWCFKRGLCGSNPLSSWLLQGLHGCYRVNILLFSWISPCMVLTGPIYVKVWPWHSSKVHISSVESQKGVTAVQRCSIENQRGTIAVQRLWQYHPSGSQWTSLNCSNALLVLNGTSLNCSNALLVLNGTLLNCNNALLALNWRFLWFFSCSHKHFHYLRNPFDVIQAYLHGLRKSVLEHYRKIVVVSIAKSHNPNNINILLHCFHFIKGACTQTYKPALQS